MTTWPADPFPQLPDRDGWREQFPKNVVRTANDAGPAKQRRRYTAGVSPQSINITMTGEEVVQFKTFWAIDCGQGALPFTWKNAREDVSYSFQFKGDDPPVVTNTGGNIYKVSFLVEQLP